MAPRSQLEVEQLFQTMTDLAQLEPDFVCVTCRPASRDQTVELVTRIQLELRLTAMAHLICAGTNRREILASLDRLESGGIENVLALRGDRENGGSPFSGDLAHGSDLCALIADRGTFCIGGACYPEKHPESASIADDLTHTRAKIENGASFLITQLFFDNSSYEQFVDAASASGIDVPILPGVMPITHFRQMARVKEMGAVVPAKLEAMLLRYEQEPDAVREIGIAWASIQCAQLLKLGAPGIHFYTFNRSPATRAVHGALRATRPTNERAPLQPLASSM
jgi:methylenetetrahydrofolate reductase (NADPH)